MANMQLFIFLQTYLVALAGPVEREYRTPLQIVYGKLSMLNVEMMNKGCEEVEYVAFCI